MNATEEPVLSDDIEPPKHDQHLLEHARTNLTGAQQELARVRYLRHLEDAEHPDLTKGDLGIKDQRGRGKGRGPVPAKDPRPATLWDVAHSHLPPQSQPLRGKSLTTRLAGLEAVTAVQQGIVDEQEALKAAHDEWIRSRGVTEDTVKDPANLPNLVLFLDQQVQDQAREIAELRELVEAK